MRPPRLPREQYRGLKTISVTINVEQRQPIFTDETLVRRLEEILHEELPKHGCRAPIYCFMPDHLHLMVQGLSDDADILTPVERFKLRAGILLAIMKVPAKLQSGFYDHIVRCGDDWRKQGRYIALNPVRAGLVGDLMAYPFTGVIGEDRREMLLAILFD